MKTRILAISISIISMVSAFAGNTVTYEHPEIFVKKNMNNQYDIQFNKVEFTDTSTIVNVTDLRKSKPFKYPTHAYLAADNGKKYYIHGMKKEGENILLYFNALPKTTKYFDYLNRDYFYRGGSLFGIHDASYKMNFPALSSYDTSSEEITDAEKFFTPGSATLIVKEDNQKPLYGCVTVWTDFQIGDSETNKMYERTPDSLTHSDNHYNTYTMRVPVNFQRFSDCMYDRLSDDINYCLVPGKTTEVYYQGDHDIIFSESSPLPHLANLLTATKLYDAAPDEMLPTDEQWGYLALRYKLNKQEIHILRRTYLDLPKIVQVVYANDSTVEEAMVKNNFRNRKIEDFAILNELHINDLSYLMLNSNRIHQLLEDVYDEILRDVYGDKNANNYQCRWKNMPARLLEVDNKIFHSKQPSTLLQLWMLNKQRLANWITVARVHPDSKKELDDYVAAARKLIVTPHLLQIFEQNYQELSNKKTTEKIQEFKIFEDEL